MKTQRVRALYRGTSVINYAETRPTAVFRRTTAADVRPSILNLFFGEKLKLKFVYLSKVQNRQAVKILFRVEIYLEIKFQEN